MDGDGGGRLEITDSQINSAGGDAHGIVISGSSDTMVLNHTGVSASGGDSVIIYARGTQSVSINGGVIQSDHNGINIDAYLDDGVVNLAVTGGAEVTGAAVLNVGGTAGSTVKVTVEQNSSLRGEVNTSGSTTTTINLDDSTLTGGITAADAAALTVSLDHHSTFTGQSTLSGNGIINLSLINNANWNLTGKSKLTTLHGADGGAITIDNVQGEDLTVSGGISGQTRLNIGGITTA
jgi:hypothetical protein